MSEARSATRVEESPGLASPRLVPRIAALQRALQAAIEEEIALRRPFLWLAVAAGAGVVLYFSAEREPTLPYAGVLFAVFASAALLSRAHARLHALLLIAACVSGGFFSASWRAARAEAPVLSRVAIGDLTGFVEEVDPRRAGARFILRVASAEGLPGAAPRRARLTTRGEPNFSAGDFVGLKARLLPPAHAALPGGYDFARDAYFLGLGAVGNALGRIDTIPAPDPAPWPLRFFAAVDRLRNALALRVYHALEDDSGAIAAAMVTGKRDLLSQEARDLIRRAGVFHIITISGVQMTLVAGIFFVGLRRLLALSRTLALNYPIKKWAAALAMIGAVLYDLLAGSRVGTERALVMTLIMLTAVLFDRPSLSMRNLALAVFFVVAFEPEALLGAGFQLSFVAVAALIAVYELRGDLLARRRAAPADPRLPSRMELLRGEIVDRLLRGPGAALFATLCATSATASFMAGDFHELSPYVLIGNPLTLAAIEFFAVPCALLGAALYPLGLDGFVWRWLGVGIDVVTSLAGLIARAPGASLHVKAFAPWALVFLALAVLSLTLWRSRLLRLTALPFALIGLLGATSGEGFDLAVAATGEAAALRLPSGELAVLGKNPSAFVAEQWLRADGDARDFADSKVGVACDSLGCVGRAIDGRLIALVYDLAALIEDCARAAVIVTPLYAPQGCAATLGSGARNIDAATLGSGARNIDAATLGSGARNIDAATLGSGARNIDAATLGSGARNIDAAPLVVDRRKLAETGAVSLRFREGRIEWTPARARGEDRPWSRAPKERKAEPVAATPRREEGAADENGE